MNLNDEGAIQFDKSQKLFSYLDTNIFKNTDIDSNETKVQIQRLDDYQSLE